MVSIQIDTYGDARNNLGLVANIYGSQKMPQELNQEVLEGKIVKVGVLIQILNMSSHGRLTDFGYEVEVKIPFSISFQMEKIKNGK